MPYSSPTRYFVLVDLESGFLYICWFLWDVDSWRLILGWKSILSWTSGAREEKFSGGMLMIRNGMGIFELLVINRYLESSSPCNRTMRSLLRRHLKH